LKTYSENLAKFDEQAETTFDKEVATYYKTAFQHELNEVEENFNKWELKRIY